MLMKLHTFFNDLMLKFKQKRKKNSKLRQIVDLMMIKNKYYLSCAEA